VKELFYLGNLDNNSKTYEIYKKQYNSPGAMISFEVKGGEKEAFTFLNNLKVIKLAVSLGSTESLAQHPASMTHIGLAPEDKMKFGISPSLVRLSVGIENAQDLIEEIRLALDAIQ
jgi:methionine-gamma-lyase